jgi:outer membrane receptor for ferrienterochelin and colicins
METTAWYTRFSNSIIPDYDSNQIRLFIKPKWLCRYKRDKYKYGFSFYQWIKMILGATYMDVSKPKTTPQPANSTEKSRQPGQFLSHQQAFLDVDYTGNLYGPMFTAFDHPRKQYSDMEHSKYTIHFQQI